MITLHRDDLCLSLRTISVRSSVRSTPTHTLRQDAMRDKLRSSEKKQGIVCFNSFFSHSLAFLATQKHSVVRKKQHLKRQKLNKNHDKGLWYVLSNDNYINIPQRVKYRRRKQTHIIIILIIIIKKTEVSLIPVSI